MKVLSCKTINDSLRSLGATFDDLPVYVDELKAAKGESVWDSSVG